MPVWIRNRLYTTVINKLRSKSRLAFAHSKGANHLQSGYNYHLVILVLFNNGNIGICNYHKLVEYLNSLVSQIDISIVGPAKGYISIPKMDIPTPKIPGLFDKFNSTVMDSGWSPSVTSNYHFIYDKISGLLSQVDSPLFLLLGIFLCILVFFLIPGMNILGKSLTDGIKYSLGTGIGNGINNCLSSINDKIFYWGEDLSSYIVDSKSSFSQEFIDFNNNITLLSSLGLNTLSTTLGTGIVVWMVNNISNEYTGPYLYQDSRYDSEINTRFRNLWHDFSWFNLDVGHRSLDRIRSPSRNNTIQEAALSRHDLNFFHVDAWRDFPNSHSIFDSYNTFIRDSREYYTESELRIRIRETFIGLIDELYGESSNYDNNDVNLFLMERLNEFDRSMLIYLNNMNEIVEELSHVLATHNLTVTPALDGNPLSIGNCDSMDESSIRELTNRVRDLDNRLRTINNRIVFILDQIIVWENVQQRDTRLRSLYLSRPYARLEPNIRVDRIEYLSRRYRFLVIYRIMPDLTIRYTHFNLFDR